MIKTITLTTGIRLGRCYPISLPYVDAGNAIYETQAPGVDALKAKFLAEPQLVAEGSGQLIGWAFLSAVCSSDRASDRSAGVDPDGQFAVRQQHTFPR